MTTRNLMGGSIASVELTSQNPTATQEFFEAAFDWEFQFDVDLGHTVWRGPQPLAGGLMTAEGDTDEYPTTCALAGGGILRKLVEIAGWGTAAVLRAPGTFRLPSGSH